MAVSPKPGRPPEYAAEFVDLAQTALVRLAECTRMEDREPLQRDADGRLSPAWTTWHDQLHANRDQLLAALRLLLEHDDYETAHRRQWRDSITVRSTARVAWAPVARRVLRDVATAQSTLAATA